MRSAAALLVSSALALAAPEADPQLLAYGGLAYAGLPAAGLVGAPVGAVAHVPVVKSVVDSPAEVSQEVATHTVPVAVGYHGFHYGYGKRSADAEPAVVSPPPPPSPTTRPPSPMSLWPPPS